MSDGQKLTDCTKLGLENRRYAQFELRSLFWTPEVWALKENSGEIVARGLIFRGKLSRIIIHSQALFRRCEYGD